MHLIYVPLTMVLFGITDRARAAARKAEVVSLIVLFRSIIKMLEIINLSQRNINGKLTIKTKSAIQTMSPRRPATHGSRAMTRLDRATGTPRPAARDGAGRTQALTRIDLSEERRPLAGINAGSAPRTRSPRRRPVAAVSARGEEMPRHQQQLTDRYQLCPGQPHPGQRLLGQRFLGSTLPGP